MRSILNNIVLLLCCSHLAAQQFSVLYDHDEFANDGSTIVSTVNGYLCSHSSIDIANDRFSVLISFHSNNSILNASVSMSDNSNIFSLTEPNFGIIYFDNTSTYNLFGNHQENSNDFNKPFILGFSEIGNIIDTLYIDALSEYNLFTQGACIGDNNLFILCQTYNSAESFLIKCDISRNYLSHSISSIGFQSNPKFIKDVEDGLLIGGTFFIVDQPNAVPWQYIRKFDYDGQLLWTNIIEPFELTALPSMGAVNALPMNNGNVLFAGTATSGQLLQERFRPMIGEIDDTTGDTLWTRKYFSADSIYILHNFKRLSSGEYIGVGETRQQLNFQSNPYITTAFIMKLDSEYNLLWKRVYTPIGFASGPTIEPTCRLNDFVENDDGGITALGRAFTYTGTGPQSGYIQDSWLLRVDREGCLVSGCAVDITEYENDKHLFVYPNPANDQLNIQFPNRDKWQVSIYNMQGALVREESANQLLQYSLDVQELPSGIYALVCSGSEDLFTQQFIKH